MIQGPNLLLQSLLQVQLDNEKLSNNIMSPLFILCAEEKVKVTAADPLVVENALVKVVVDLIG